MYKVIHNNTVIDVLDKIKYVKFLSKVNRTISTDRTSADGIVGSDNKTIYVLQGHKCPEGKSYKTVQLREIDEPAFKSLKEKLGNKESVSNNIALITTARREKIEQLSKLCNETITKGLHILLSDGMYHHFKLTIEDQINLASIQQDINNSNKNIIYHETGKVCQVYSRDDMKRVIRETTNFRNHHTTYFNLLKYCINNMTDVDNINNIKYGDDLLSLNIPSKVRSIVKELQHG